LLKSIRAATVMNFGSSGNSDFTRATAVAQAGDREELRNAECGLSELCSLNPHSAIGVSAPHDLELGLPGSVQSAASAT
jgi:hypothetical protein